MFQTSFFMLLFLVSIRNRPGQLWSTFQSDSAHPALLFSNIGYQLVVPFFVSLFFFGQTVFPRIPFTIGGGSPREIKVVLKFETTKLEHGKLFLIGESAQFLFV